MDRTLQINCKTCYMHTSNINLQIPATTTRILLNHFKWDKEKLMERFYDGDQEKLFAEARVINPFRKGPLISRSRSSQSSLVNVRVQFILIIYFVADELPKIILYPFLIQPKRPTNGTEECGICFMILPSSVSLVYQNI